MTAGGLGIPCTLSLKEWPLLGLVSFKSFRSVRKAAAFMLAALDFEQLAAESKKTSKKPEKLLNSTSSSACALHAPKLSPAARNKSQTANEGQTTDKKKPNIGDELEGKVTAKTSRGLRMNVAGNEAGRNSLSHLLRPVEMAACQAFLLASELCDGFPEDVPKLGSTFQVRVLQNKKLLQVTRREGSLERQSYSDLKFDASVLQDLDPSSKVEAEVIGFDFTNAFLKIVSPSDPSKMTLANLPRKDFAEGAEKEIRIGSKIQVRRKYSKRGRDIVSMREQPDRQPKDLNVGDTLTGTVDSILQGPRPAIFLDVGFDRPAYMDWQECGEGHNANNFRSLKRGQSTSVRVLAVQGDRIYVTRRPGDLHRASLDGSGRLPKNTADIMSKFMALPLEQELEGKVYRLYPRYASIAVKSPDGDTADGYLGIDYFSKSFIQEAAPGLTVAVRRLPKQNAEGPRLMLTMQSSSTAGGSNEQADTLQEEPCHC